MSNPAALHDIDNELLRDADEYLRKHKIMELFEVTLKSFSTLSCLTSFNYFVYRI